MSRSTFSLAGLRLLIVADSSTTHTVRWAQWFAGRGCEVTVLSPFHDKIEGVNVITFPPKPRWYHKIPKARMLFDLFPFRRLIRQIDPQLIHFHFVSEGGRAFFWNGFSTPMIASSWGQDVIFDTGPRPKAAASLLKIFERANFITATTHMLARETANFTPPGKDIYVIPFGVDLSRFSIRPPMREGPAVIGFVKHLLPKYGPDVLIDAFAIIHKKRPQTRLVMAGRGTMREELEKKIAEHRLGRAVDILGRVPHEQVPALIQSFDIMAMPSVYESETFGVAAIEASACGVPVVASKVGGVPEAVLHDRTGILVPPRDANALAEACISLIDSPQRRNELGAAGRRFVEKYYVWQKNAALMEEMYRAAIETDQPRQVPIYQPGIECEFEL